jgi:hypothetical protein
MKIILTEEQYKYILIESTLKDTLKDLKINTGILFTFGTGIGAFIGPVERLLSGSGFSMNEKDIILLIITSFALIIKDSESTTLLEKVKEKGLMEALKGVINFITNVKNVVNAVSKNLVGVTYSLLDILGFALLLNPTMKILNDVIKDNDITANTTDKLLSGVALATTVYALKSIFGKIKNKKNLSLSSGESSDLNENYVRVSDDSYSDLIDVFINQGIEEEYASTELDNLISYYEKLPNNMVLYRLIFSDTEEEIDKQYPGYHYTRKKNDLLDNHYFKSYRDSSTGENAYIIKVKAQKQMIDFYESIKNNILYPGEKEITLKDKGFGVKIIEIMPINN